LLEIARAYHNPRSHMDNYTKNLGIVKNLERIGDLNLNLVGFFHLMNQNNETFTDLAVEELDLMIKGLLDILT
jgi:Na+/phosphate symporter